MDLWSITEKSCACQTVAKHLCYLYLYLLWLDSLPQLENYLPSLLAQLCACACVYLLVFLISCVCALFFHLLHNFNEFGFFPFPVVFFLMLSTILSSLALFFVLLHTLFTVSVAFVALELPVCTPAT